MPKLAGAPHRLMAWMLRVAMNGSPRDAEAPHRAQPVTIPPVCKASEDVSKLISLGPNCWTIGL